MRPAAALLGAFLACACFLEGARLVERLVRLRVDVSEDRLLEPSDATRRLFAGLEDVAQLELYFTGGSESAAFQLARARVVSELAELVDLADGRLRLVYEDPSRSSTAALAATEYGVDAQQIQTVGGSRLSSEIVFLGGVLRYRGAEHVFPSFYPGGVEYQVAAAVDRLTRARRPRLGWLDAGRAPERFRTARELLAQRVEIVPLGGLAEGTEVGDVDAVAVLAPEELHPRAVFELDQYLQRGGSLLLALDRSYAGVEEINERRLEPVVTGLEAWLARLGLELSPDLVWDSLHHRPLQLRRAVRDGAGTVREEQLEIPYPLWPYVAPAGFDQTNPATARLRGLPLRWAHPLGVREDRPGSLALERLIETSERSYTFGFRSGLEFDPEAIELTEAELIAEGEAGPRLVGAALVGRFPSPFVERGAPLARDPFGGEDRARPGDDEVASAAAEARLVVVSDADWLAERGGRIAPESAFLLENLVDWLGLSPELLALRAKRPSDRSIRDLEREAFEARGLSTLQAAAGGGRAERSKAETEALAAARVERRRRMLTALAGSGALILSIVAGTFARRAWRGRRLLEPRAEPDGGGRP